MLPTKFIAKYSTRLRLSSVTPTIRFNKNLPKGFTLIELLLTITIIGILTAAIVPSFSGYIRMQNVKQAEEQLKSDLRNVQNKALTGALSDQMIGSNPVRYWGVKFVRGTNNSHRYEYFVSAVNNTCPSSIPAAQNQGYSELTSDLEVKVSATQCIYFSISNGSISTYPTMSNRRFIVGYKGSTTAGDCRRVLFNTGGLIYTNSSNLCT